ncbi:element excision factor XisH family protein [Geitlerinema sp. CS-897]|nr:element excision factor XisH family protein [Geitlerinema sp. CS-897]
MSAKDVYHDTVKTVKVALTKDGWVVTHDRVHLTFVKTQKSW